MSKPIRRVKPVWPLTSHVPSMCRVVGLTITYAVTPVPFTFGPPGPWSMYVRWPQSAPFFTPPATPNVPFAPDGVPVIQPPPVTKSRELSQLGWPAHSMSACADETTTSATPVTMTCSAFTVMLPGPAVCSFTITRPAPSGRNTVWLGAPETAIDWPLMTRSATCDEPLVCAVPLTHRASARAMSSDAPTVCPPTVRFKSAVEASERECSPWATVLACRTCAVATPGTVASRSEASCAPPEPGSGPACEIVVVDPRTVARSAVASPLKLVEPGRPVDCDAASWGPRRRSSWRGDLSQEGRSKEAETSRAEIDARELIHAMSDGCLMGRTPLPG